MAAVDVNVSLALAQPPGARWDDHPRQMFVRCISRSPPSFEWIAILSW